MVFVGGVVYRGSGLQYGRKVTEKSEKGFRIRRRDPLSRLSAYSISRAQRFALSATKVKRVRELRGSLREKILMAFIEVRNLFKRFKKVVAVNHIDLEVDK